MTRPPRPVYLMLPSHRTSDSAALCAGFVDQLARWPQVDEDVLLGIVEFSTFTNELAPLGHPLDQSARAQLSGFAGTCYAGLFDGMAGIVAYDAYRFAAARRRLGVPLIVVVIDTPPEPDDQWAPALHRLREFGPMIVAIEVGGEADGFAGDIAETPGPSISASDADDAARLAAAAVSARVWGIG